MKSSLLTSLLLAFRTQSRIDQCVDNLPLATKQCYRVEMNHHPVMTWYDVTFKFAGTAGTLKKQIKHIIIVIMHGPQGIRKKEIWQILTNTIILSGFVIYVSFPYRYNDIHVHWGVEIWPLPCTVVGRCSCYSFHVLKSVFIIPRAELILHL